MSIVQAGDISLFSVGSVKTTLSIEGCFFFNHYFCIYFILLMYLFIYLFIIIIIIWFGRGQLVVRQN